MDQVLADTLTANLRAAKTPEAKQDALVLAMIALVDCQLKTATRVKTMWEERGRFAWAGVHDSNAAIWKDISGNGHDATAIYPTADKTAPTWGEKSYISTRRYSAFYWFVGKILAGTSSMTLEISVSNANTNYYRWFFADLSRSNRVKIQRYDTANTIAYAVLNTTPYYDRTSTDGLINAALVYDGSRRIAYREGTKKNTATVSGDYSVDADTEYAIAQEYGAYNTEYHCVRLYSRALSDTEVSANAAVDQQRFGLLDTP